MYINEKLERSVLMFQYRIICMLSEKEQDKYINRLLEQHNLIPISKRVKKRSADLIKNNIDPYILEKELEKPLSDLNIDDLENRALILYLALINPKRFHLSKEKTKQIPEMILKLADYAREQVKLQGIAVEKNKSFNRKRSVKFFIGLLVCVQNHLCDGSLLDKDPL